MNKRQKIVQEEFLNNEEAVIKRLKQVYNQSLKDITRKSHELQVQINELNALEKYVSDPEELAKLQSMKQSKVYQKQYQEALKKQIISILDNMQVEEFKTVSEYLNKCYEEGFLGTMYDLHGQGIPLIMPLDQEAMVRAVQTDSKISQGLYTRLGEDVSLLKKKITAQVSRGIATGMSFQQMAQQLAAYTNIGYNNAVRIIRTEGHRIQVQSTMDACYKAKDKGADVVKQWDSTLDGRTRSSHARVDGEIKELDEKFSNGLMFPSDPNGGASEVVNCRCALLQRARWALDEDELQTLKERAKYYGLDKNDNFEDFKNKYLKAADTLKTKGGLGAKISGDGIPEHEEPMFLKTIDYKNKDDVAKELKNFEKSAINESIETACVVTKDGEVFKCFGVNDRVFPDFDLKNKLKGSSISHNHPIEETTYTFSMDDMALFMEYDLEILRGCDEKYTYEFTRNALEIDDEPDDWMNFENFCHADIIRHAKEYGIGYRRWFNE